MYGSDGLPVKMAGLIRVRLASSDVCNLWWAARSCLFRQFVSMLGSRLGVHKYYY